MKWRVGARAHARAIRRRALVDTNICSASRDVEQDASDAPQTTPPTTGRAYARTSRARHKRADVYILGGGQYELSSRRGSCRNVEERLRALGQATRLLPVEQLADGGTSTPGESPSWRVPTMPATSTTITVGRDRSSPRRLPGSASKACRLVASMPAPSRSSSAARRASAGPMPWQPSACQRRATCVLPHTLPHGHPRERRVAGIYFTGSTGSSITTTSGPCARSRGAVRSAPPHTPPRSPRLRSPHGSRASRP